MRYYRENANRNKLTCHKTDSIEFLLNKLNVKFDVNYGKLIPVSFEWQSTIYAHCFICDICLLYYNEICSERCTFMGCTFLFPI